MKIKISICTDDNRYSKRLIYYFNAHYFDKFSWNVYTQPKYLLDSFVNAIPDIILIGEEWKSDIEGIYSSIGNKCAYACLVDELDENSADDVFVQIEKYDRADKIYRNLLELYSHTSDMHRLNHSFISGETEIYAFVSANGGAGASTIANAAAKSYARYEKVLYINLENTGAMQLVFHEQGKLGFDDIMFALKSRRKALQLKIESTVSRDNTGVYFFGECKNALNLQELTQNDLKELLTEIQNAREYDKVILDIGNGLQEKEVAALSFADRVVVIMNHNEVAERKLERYITALLSIEEQKKVEICSKMILFYNKVLKSMQLPEQMNQIRVGGGFPQIENGTFKGIIEKIADMEMIHNIG